MCYVMKEKKKAMEERSAESLPNREKMLINAIGTSSTLV